MEDVAAYGGTAGNQWPYFENPEYFVERGWYGAYGPNGVCSRPAMPMAGSLSVRHGRDLVCPAAGYMVDVPLDLDLYTKSVAELEAKSWADVKTRVVFVSFFTYNPNFNLFTYTLGAFEHNGAGLVKPWYLPPLRLRRILCWLLLFVSHVCAVAGISLCTSQCRQRRF